MYCEHEGVQNCPKLSKIAWRHLWMIPNTNFVDEDVTVLGVRGSMILWQQYKGLSSKTRDSGGRGSKIVQIVWRHLWTIPNTNLVDEDVTLFQISFFLLLTTKWNHILLRNYWRHQFWLIHWTSKKKCHMFRFDNPKFFVLSSPLMTSHSQ